MPTSLFRFAGQQSCTLGCAFAERGHPATGVDPAAAMLVVAKRKPSAEQVEWVESSAQTYRSERRFDLMVMTGHAFQILLIAGGPRDLGYCLPVR